MKKTIEAIFFCDNCGGCRTSLKRKVRLTKEGAEIVSDTCEVCGVTQEIESMGESTIEKHRIRNEEDPE